MGGWTSGLAERNNPSDWLYTPQYSRMRMHITPGCWHNMKREENVDIKAVQKGIEWKHRPTGVRRAWVVERILYYIKTTVILASINYLPQIALH